MSKKKDLAKKPDPSADPDRPDPATMLAVVRTQKSFELAHTGIVGLVVLGCFGILYAALGRVAWGTTTILDFNFVVNIAVSVALTAAISGGAIVRGNRQKRRAERAVNRNDALEQKLELATERAERAEKRADDLAADLDRLRGREG